MSTLKGWAIDLTGSITVEGVLLNGFKFALVILEPITFVVLELVVVWGFFSIDNNSAEDNFTLEREEADFKPVAAEAKLSILKKN